MSDRAIWKMLHLLYTLKPGLPGLTASQLNVAGVDCGTDTISPLLYAGAVSLDAHGVYSLTEPALRIMQSCVVANRRWAGKDMLVDAPEVFVVMPFSEPWSDNVFNGMIEPAIQSVRCRCVRGDTPPRVGDLTQTIWSALSRAGLVIADVTALNANVFYEIGLTHALGKDCFILKEQNARVPADFGGSHYYEYQLNDLGAGRMLLEAELRSWVNENMVEGVRLIADM